MVDSGVIEYINKHKNNYRIEKLREALIKHGYKPDIVDEAIKHSNSLKTKKSKKDALNKYDFIYSLSVHAIFCSLLLIIWAVYFISVFAPALGEDVTPGYLWIIASLIIIVISSILIKKSKNKRMYHRVLLLFFTEGWIQFFIHTRGKGAISTSKKEVLFLLVFAVVLLIIFLIFAFVLIPQWTGVAPEDIQLPSIFDLYFND